MKRMTRKQYIEKLEEFIREIPDIQDYDLVNILEETGLDFENNTKIPEVEREHYVFGIDAGLRMAVKLLTDL